MNFNETITPHPLPIAQTFDHIPTHCCWQVQLLLVPFPGYGKKWEKNQEFGFMNWKVCKMNHICNEKFKTLTFRLEPESLATDLHNLKNIRQDINGHVWLNLNA